MYIGSFASNKIPKCWTQNRAMTTRYADGKFLGHFKMSRVLCTGKRAKLFLSFRPCDLQARDRAKEFTLAENLASYFPMKRRYVYVQNGACPCHTLATLYFQRGPIRYQVTSF